MGDISSMTAHPPTHDGWRAYLLSFTKVRRSVVLLDVNLSLYGLWMHDPYCHDVVGESLDLVMSFAFCINTKKSVCVGLSPSRRVNAHSRAGWWASRQTCKEMSARQRAHLRWLRIHSTGICAFRRGKRKYHHQPLPWSHKSTPLIHGNPDITRTWK